MSNFKNSLLEHVLFVTGTVSEPLINLINEKIYIQQKDLFRPGSIQKKVKEYKTDPSIRSVLVKSFEEEDIGNSVSNRIIFNELKKLTNLIESIYREKISDYYVSASNYFQFLYYDAGMQGHYSFHTDYSKISPRALTIIIGLNSKNEYEGGKLKIHNDLEGKTLDKGDVICFPSNFMFPHKVEKVTQGERKVLVIWTQ